MDCIHSGRQRFKFFAAGRLVLIALAMFSGCGDSGYARVSGTVTLDGQPLPRGMVQFVPVDDANGEAPTAVGEIQADGRYRLMSGGIEGARVGKHRVRIDARALPLNERDTLPASLIPERYQSETTSELAADVVAGKTNVVDLTLRSP